MKILNFNPLNGHRGAQHSQIFQCSKHGLGFQSLFKVKMHSGPTAGPNWGPVTTEFGVLLNKLFFEATKNSNITKNVTSIPE